MNPENVYAKDLSNLAAIVNWGVDQKKYGSYSDRRPDLGAMSTCPYCRVRRRVNGPLCCNHPFTKDADGNDWSNDAMFSKPMLKKLMHKGHGQNKAFHVRQQTLLFQRDEALGINSMGLLPAAAREMHVRVPELGAIPSFAERYTEWKNERKDRAERRRARTSRRKNRGPN